MAAATATALLGGAALLVIGSAPMTIFAGMIAVPWAFLIPLLIATAALMLCTTPFADWEMTATRRIRAREVLIRAVYVLGAAGAAGAAVVTREPASVELAIQVARNTIGLSGLSLLLASTLGPAVGGAVPLCYSIVAILGGRDEAGSPHWWAWILEDGNSLGAFVGAVALATAGACVPIARAVRTSTD